MMPDEIAMRPLQPNTDAGLMGVQRDMIWMLEAALKIVSPDDPALVKLKEVREALKAKRGKA